MISVNHKASDSGGDAGNAIKEDETVRAVSICVEVGSKCAEASRFNIFRLDFVFANAVFADIALIHGKAAKRSIQPEAIARRGARAAQDNTADHTPHVSMGFGRGRGGHVNSGRLVVLREGTG